MRSSSSISSILLIIFALLASIWLGESVVTNQMSTLVWMLVVIGGLFCALMGPRIWILLLFLLQTEVVVIRGFSSSEVGQMIFIGFCVLMFLMRRLSVVWRFGEMDRWRFFLAFMVLQVYVRNPVGLNILGSSSVGARPYFLVCLFFVSGMILSKYVARPQDIKWAYLASLGGVILNYPIMVAKGALMGGPASAPVSSVQYVNSSMTQDGGGRDGRFNLLSGSFAQIVVSRISPLKAVVTPLWALVVLASVAMAAASGFRNAIAWVGILYLVGIAYRGGRAALFLSCILGALSLTVLSVYNQHYPLPRGMQRALSPLPGKWDEAVVEGAALSTEWRVEMWEAALLTDDWIKNKFFGDGMGMTREEMEKMISLEDLGSNEMSSGLTVQQESMMITGSYHSGPVHCVRIVGYMGLILILVIFARMANYGHRLIHRCRGTPHQACGYFFGIYMVAYPFFWALVFGTFEDAAFHIFVNSAVMDFLHRNLPVPAYISARQTIHRPLGWQHRRGTDPTLIHGIR